MELTKKCFDILSTIAVNNTERLSQRRLQELTGHSLGTINRNLKDLSANGLICEGAITADGLEALEPYRAKKAIFVAAGFGTRLVPITLNTPKPLIRVNGKRIIDTAIDICLAKGIREIYVVRGYLAEQFDMLLHKYPMIKFLDNPVYNETNNISSAMCARFLLPNSYVLEADILINNPDVIQKYHYYSNYLGISKERSEDWCFTTKDGFIDKWGIGGVNCYQEVGISYWNEADGNRLCGHLKECYDAPGGKERFWDYAALSEFKDQYKIAVRECVQEDISEIDTFNELKQIDKSYNV